MSGMVKFSVVTIVKGRRTQLANLLDSVAKSMWQPHDVQIVCMDDGSDISVPEGLPAMIHVLNNEGELPLAAARNAGIKAAQTDNVVFIDVDCIVSPTLFENMVRSLQPDAVITAYPMYLPSVPQNGNYQHLKPAALPHPGRTSLPVGTAVAYYQFWSIIFAITRETFIRVGGFDEAFTGYGAEDTDFAKSFDKAGIRMLFVRDYVLHQYHTKYDPPLNHFDAIVQNATTYRNKWGELPMRKWLDAFKDMGLINIDNDHIRIVRRPTPSEIERCLSLNPY